VSGVGTLETVIAFWQAGNAAGHERLTLLESLMI